MSKFIEENKTIPYKATISGLDAGAASIHLAKNNGVIEVTHGDGGAVLLQTKNVKDGTWDKIWALLESCGETVYRARG
jgi:hypothetical protein